MKKSKLLIIALLCTFVLLLMTSCKSRSNLSISKKSSLKAKCSATECIKKIKVENTVEEVNKIIGVDGKIIDERYNFYEYDLGNNGTIILKYYSGDKAIIISSYNKDEISNKKVNLSKIEELKSKVNLGITYDEFKEEIGGIDGTLIEKSELSNKYIWVSKKGGSVIATFKTSDNVCSFFSGYKDIK
jgi:hypothetical protein